MKFSPELIQQIKSAVNLVDVVGEHVVLRKSGSNYVGLCPFHSERSPSFSVSENKQVYHCYGCKAGGDLIGFVQQIHGLSFHESVQDLADRAGISVPRGAGDSTGEAEQKRAEQRERIALAHKLNRFAAGFFRQQMSAHSPGQEYLRTRGVDPDLEKAFYVGWAPHSWDVLTEHLIKSKAPLEMAVKLGLIKPSQPGARPGGPGYFDLFRNRVMFPILDQKGKVAGFGGRLLGNEEGPKYLNSPESPVFQKSKLLFGLFQAAKHIREQNEVVIVEGYFDVLGLHAAGLKNVVATCGTSLTSDHLKILGRFAEKITIFFDGDRAGRDAMDRAMEVGLQAGVVVFGAFLPDGVDPDEFVLRSPENGKERLVGILREARPLLDLRLEEAVAEAARGPEARTQALKRAAGWLALFQDPVGRQVRMEDLRQKLGVSGNLIAQAMGGAPPVGRSVSGSTPTAVGVPIRPKRVPPISDAEKTSLQVLVRVTDFGSLLEEFGRNLPPKVTISDLFEHPELQEIVARILPDGIRAVPVETWLTAVESVQIRSVITEAAVSQEPLFSELDLARVLEHWTGRLWARFSQRLKNEMNVAEQKKDPELQRHLMQEYLDVQRRMKELTGFYGQV